MKPRRQRDHFLLKICPRVICDLPHQYNDRARSCVLAPNGPSSMPHGYQRQGLAAVQKALSI